MATVERLVYEVIITLAAGTDVDVFADWMRDHHIPSLLATGCFSAAEFACDDAVTLHFRTRYFAVDRAALGRYLHDHAGRLRADFQRHFGEGSTVRRETWRILEVWER